VFICPQKTLLHGHIVLAIVTGDESESRVREAPELLRVNL